MRAGADDHLGGAHGTVAFDRSSKLQLKDNIALLDGVTLVVITTPFGTGAVNLNA